MDTEKLNSWLSLVANIGVLIGLIVLIYEIQQNNLIAKSQTRTDILTGLTEITVPHMEEFGHEIMHRASTGEDLTEAEVFWLERRYNLLLRYHENIHYQYRNGLFDETEMNSYRSAWSSIACGRYRRPHFDENKDGFQPEFIEDVERYVGTISCTN